ncbi:MAG: phosphatase PAP2 family protein [Deltaproteobacteria bacterium]|jgi:acid phosphatase (class A)|nr:phosphatase PAP2 family protein [Deltaproteobacteria bacterium]
MKAGLRNVAILALMALMAWAAPPMAALAAPEGFLSEAEDPVLDFLPAPPVDESPDFARDINVYWRTRTKRDDDRWLRASADADIARNWNVIFKDSFGLTLDKKNTPFTYELLARASSDVEVSFNEVKDKYKRPRPFVYFNQPFGTTCLPAEEASIKNNGSYPSGHSAYSWLMAQILSEISPERLDAIMARGLDYGFSRVICGVHWVSDIEAGRYVASAVNARLHGNLGFQELLAKAKAEIARLRATPPAE